MSEKQGDILTGGGRGVAGQRPTYIEQGKEDVAARVRVCVSE